MKIFFSFAKEQVEIAESIYRKLLAANYQAFFASGDIRASDGYDDRIRREVAKADRMIFLASKESLAEGKYTLTELRMFSEKWPDPTGRVMTVLLDDVSYHNLPPYLGAVVSAFMPKGNIPSEVVAAVVSGWPVLARHRRMWGVLAALVVIISVLVVIIVKIISITDAPKNPDTGFMPPIKYSTADDAITLIYHSHTLHRKDTFQIDPDITVWELKNSLKRHYKITVPETLSERASTGGYFLEDCLFANNSYLRNENDNLLKAGLKEFDMIEFDYVLLARETMSCHIPDVVIIIEGIHLPNPEFTLNGRNIPKQIGKTENTYHFYFKFIGECNPESWIGKLVIGDEVYFLANPRKLSDDETGLTMQFDFIADIK
jgi:hypothetical protein